MVPLRIFSFDGLFHDASPIKAVKMNTKPRIQSIRRKIDKAAPRITNNLDSTCRIKPLFTKDTGLVIWENNFAGNQKYMNFILVLVTTPINS